MIRILDGSGGDGKPLNEQDLKDFLMTKVPNVHLGTVDENGHATFTRHGTISMIQRRRSMSRRVDIQRKWKILLGTIQSTIV
jgi:hypothetical protein